ncbi:signal transducer and activator of transcription 5B-like isoform X1 [Rhopilema esculentum]|uniref:signal transducer and activator of transcription 5B-like isoform X1 n=2 Tax=Rhopilema esculentum TaxID=499914 RepID=UPI0031DD0E0C
MALWNKLQTLDDEARTKLGEIYGSNNFPLEVRGMFAEWIESQSWSIFDQNIPEHTQEAESLVNELIKKLGEKSQQQPHDLITQMRFKDLQKQIKDLYQNNPWSLVLTIKEILTAEQNLLIKAEKPMSVQSPMMEIETPESPSILDIGRFIDDLKSAAQKTDMDLKNYKQQQEDFVIRYQEICKVDVEISKATERRDTKDQMIILQKRKADIENMLKEKALEILNDREAIFIQLESLSLKIEQVSQKVYQELFLWRMNQQKSLSGGDKPDPLDELQNWFEALTDTLWSMYQLCTQFKLLFDALPIIRNGDERDKTERVLADAVSSLTKLIQRSFIVDKQPPQVLKTQTKFQASVRLLVGTKLNLQLNCPEVVTTILSEKQAKELCHGKTIEDTGSCGEILNNRSVMEYDQQLNALHADFKNLSLKKIKRQDRKGQESVLEAKSCLVFSAAITIGGEKLPVMCMSVPVVVVVHGNQGPNSEATIFWDNFFSNPDREPFEVPEEVDWDEMSFALNARWAMTTECDLKEEHLEYLGSKLFQNCEKSQSSRKKVSWHAFNKEPLKGRNFTFWEWFHSGMEVVKRHLKDHWKEGYLEFMSREEARKKLNDMCVGTFIIRFSDGEVGGVSIAWVIEKEGGGADIWNVQPWTTKDFNIRSLADRIFDLDLLKYVYPGVEKEHAFGKFRSQDYYPREPGPDGYVMASIMARINCNQQQQHPAASRMDSLPSPPSREMLESQLINRFNPMMNLSGDSDAMFQNADIYDEPAVQHFIEDILANGDGNSPSVEDFIRNLELE